MSRDDLDEILVLYKSALREATLVTDEVLAKANPSLPNIYRSYFQKRYRASHLVMGKSQTY